MYLDVSIRIYRYLHVSACICVYLPVSACICLYLRVSMYIYVCKHVCMYVCTVTDRIMEKKRFNLQAPPVDDRKVTNLFFSIIIVSIIIFSIILSVTVCPSIRNLNAF